jgi:pimeloyl-ACP methyl ester carboxylesterase
MLPGQGHSEKTGNWSESPLLINPGGPGGSGVQLVLLAGQALQSVVGTDHDIIGFDPRGIGASIPNLDCFLPSLEHAPPDDGLRGLATLHRLTWMDSELQIGLANTSDTAASRIVTHKKAWNALCHNQDDEDSILRHAQTPNVAQDMLRIVQAWDTWTEQEAKKMVKCPHNGGSRRQATDEEKTTAPSTRGKLVYWGFSYGSVLGATFAAMFRKTTPLQHERIKVSANS